MSMLSTIERHQNTQHTTVHCTWGPAGKETMATDSDWKLFGHTWDVPEKQVWSLEGLPCKPHHPKDSLPDTSAHTQEALQSHALRGQGCPSGTRETQNLTGLNADVFNVKAATCKWSELATAQKGFSLPMCPATNFLQAWRCGFRSRGFFLSLMTSFQFMMCLVVAGFTLN